MVSSTGTSALVDIRRRRSCTYVNAGRSDLFALAGRVSSQNREGREAGRMLDVRGHQLIPLPFELFQGVGFVRGDLRCRLGTKRGGSGTLAALPRLQLELTPSPGPPFAALARRAGAIKAEEAPPPRSGNLILGQPICLKFDLDRPAVATTLVLHSVSPSLAVGERRRQPLRAQCRRPAQRPRCPRCQARMAVQRSRRVPALSTGPCGARNAASSTRRGSTLFL
jgi:hypothetical protein